jgi:hypothetical protein
MKNRRSIKKLTISLMIAWLSIIALAGCQGSVKFAPPPLDDPPLLESMVPDKNDKTGEPGFWMNRSDAEDERNFREGLRATKKIWH